MAFVMLGHWVVSINGFYGVGYTLYERVFS